MPATPTPLVELTAAAPFPGMPCRRWFTSPRLDLIVWLDEGAAIAAFQLCYDKPLREQSLSWRKGIGYSHQAVDAGNHEGPGHKSTPLLTTATPAAPERLRRELASAGSCLPKDLLRFVDDKLRDYQEPM